MLERSQTYYRRLGIDQKGSVIKPKEAYRYEENRS